MGARGDGHGSWEIGIEDRRRVRCSPGLTGIAPIPIPRRLQLEPDHPATRMTTHPPAAGQHRHYLQPPPSPRLQPMPAPPRQARAAKVTDLHPQPHAVELVAHQQGPIRPARGRVHHGVGHDLADQQGDKITVNTTATGTRVAGKTGHHKPSRRPDLGGAAPKEPLAAGGWGHPACP